MAQLLFVATKSRMVKMIRFRQLVNIFFIFDGLYMPVFLTSQFWMMRLHWAYVPVKGQISQHLTDFPLPNEA